MLNNKIYDALKWIALICLPALVVAVPELFDTWGWAYGDQIAKTLQIIAVLIGSLLGASNVAYNAEQDEHEA